MSKRKVILLTVVCWVAGCSAYAYYWVKSILSDPNLAGYERWPIFPIFGFLVYRFPFLLLALAITIYAELIFIETFRTRG